MVGSVYNDDKFLLANIKVCENNMNIRSILKNLKIKLHNTLKEKANQYYILVSLLIAGVFMIGSSLEILTIFGMYYAFTKISGILGYIFGIWLLSLVIALIPIFFLIFTKLEDKLYQKLFYGGKI